MKICSRCVLPETFPGIRYDEDGVCNYCRTFAGKEALEIKKGTYRERFRALVSEHAGKGQYDVVMCYSGGKDSTYTLALLKNEYKLSLLAVTFDNGFIPETTFRNIRTVVENLGVDHILFKPRFDLLKKIFTETALHDIYPSKTLERASTICTSCMAIVKFSTLRLALDKKVPFIAFGWSPGQAPITSSLMKNNPAMVRAMQQTVFEPMRGVAGDAILPYFLEESHFTGGQGFPYNVSPLAFHEYNEKKILAAIAGFGWQPPAETDSNSTNCLLNSFANSVHKKRLNFHPYAMEIAGLVRTGAMTRDEGLEKIGLVENDRTVEYVRQKLGIAP